MGIVARESYPHPRPRPRTRTDTTAHRRPGEARAKTGGHVGGGAGARVEHIKTRAGLAKYVQQTHRSAALLHDRLGRGRVDFILARAMAQRNIHPAEISDALCAGSPGIEQRQADRTAVSGARAAGRDPEKTAASITERRSQIAERERAAAEKYAAQQAAQERADAESRERARAKDQEQEYHGYGMER